MSIWPRIFANVCRTFVINTFHFLYINKYVFIDDARFVKTAYSFFVIILFYWTRRLWVNRFEPVGKPLDCRSRSQLTRLLEWCQTEIHYFILFFCHIDKAEGQTANLCSNGVRLNSKYHFVRRVLNEYCMVFI